MFHLVIQERSLGIFITLYIFSTLSSRVHYEEKIEGQDCGDEVAEWVSDFLGVEGLRMVRYVEGMQSRDIHSQTAKDWEVASAAGDTVNIDSYLLTLCQSVFLFTVIFTNFLYVTFCFISYE